MLLTGSLNFVFAVSSSYTDNSGEKSLPVVFHMMKLSRSLLRSSSVAFPTRSLDCFIYVIIPGSGDLDFSGSIRSLIVLSNLSWLTLTSDSKSGGTFISLSSSSKK